MESIREYQTHRRRYKGNNEINGAEARGTSCGQNLLADRTDTCLAYQRPLALAPEHPAEGAAGRRPSRYSRAPRSRERSTREYLSEYLYAKASSKSALQGHSPEHGSHSDTSMACSLYRFPPEPVQEHPVDITEQPPEYGDHADIAAAVDTDDTADTNYSADTVYAADTAYTADTNYTVDTDYRADTADAADKNYTVGTDYTADTADTDYTVDTVYTADTVYATDTDYAADTNYTSDTAYAANIDYAAAETFDTVYTADTDYTADTVDTTNTVFTTDTVDTADTLDNRPAEERPPEITSEHPAQSLPAEHPSQPSVFRELGSLVLKIAVIVGVAALIFSFVYGFHYNVEPSMNPSVKDGDMVLYYRWDKDYRAGDLLLLTFSGESQVRRVIATAGDTVDITEDGLLINGALQQESGICQKTQRYAEGIDFPLTLGEGEVFVLADAREGATDSRIYGAVSVEDTQGTVITVLRRRSI